MFSKDFMRYLISYQPDGIEYNEKTKQTTKEINFKNKGRGLPASVLVTIGKK